MVRPLVANPSPATERKRRQREKAQIIDLEAARKARLIAQYNAKLTAGTLERAKDHTGALQSYSKLQYGSGFHRRGWREDESGTDNKTGEVRLSDEIDKPLDTNRAGRTERAIEKVDKPVDYDDNKSIAKDREATVDAARFNKRLARKIAKERRVIDVEKGDDDQADIAVYDLKTEGSRRFGDDTEVTIRNVVAESVEAEVETDLEQERRKAEAEFSRGT
jgi:hypothetical protein